MSPAHLFTQLAAAGPASNELRLCDARLALSGPSAAERYAAGHIAGAAFVDLGRDLSREQAGGPGGRHPLPSVEEFARTLARLGISLETTVVLYDDGEGAAAARFWFLLRLHGHARVSLLDGGLAAWKQEGLPLSTEPFTPPTAPQRVLVRDEAMLAARAEIERLVATRGQEGAHRPLLLDARAPERYRGEVEPLDPVAGHIPGAVNLPFGRALRGPPGDLRFKPADELRALFAQTGVAGRAVIASCGSGVTACHTLFAMSLVGLTGRLYAGSWSDWISDPAAPVGKGAQP
jgi:thiosulfate/3-mercaptopyruvate sulfurtransferase